LANQFAFNQIGDVELLPLNAPIINRYILENPQLTAKLNARQSRSEWSSLARYASRIKTHPESQIVHNTFYLPHGLAPTRGAKRIVTIHDMIPELMPQTRRRLDLLTMKRRYVDQADHVICVSHAAKNDLLRVYGDVQAPISVVHHGVDQRFRPDVEKNSLLPERYLLFVGNRNQYKDANVLFRAFAGLRKEHSDLQLLCVGGGSFTSAERELIQVLGIEQVTRQLNLPDREMVSAYAHAEIFVFPSQFEGFGLPALEAMACGVPTVLASATSLPEVGGDAAQYFKAGDAAALEVVLVELLQDSARRVQLSEKGLHRAASFTWKKTAEETAAVYQASLA
jgi:glycosyltransferase involved in cell wall biosynthesis